MTDSFQQELEKVAQNPDLKTISGSRLYGTSTPESDYDFRGFVFPPFEYLTGIQNFTCIEFEGDHKIYSAHQFISLALKGDPLCTEMFFVSGDQILKMSERGKEVLDMKNDIISMAIYSRILGYSVSEWRKAFAIKLVPEKRRKEKEELICDIRNLYSPDKETMDDFIRIMDKCDNKIAVSSMAGIGIARKEDIEKYGYCRKSVCHSLRLVGQLIELMETGKITFPRPESSLLVEIRSGKFKTDDLQKMYSEIVLKAEEKKKNSILPEKPNTKKVWEKYKKIIAKILLNDERLHQCAKEL